MNIYGKTDLANKSLSVKFCGAQNMEDAMTELLGDRTGPRYEPPQGPDFWVKKREIFRLWYEFLAISPSYQLAHIERTRGLPEDTPPKLPADFSKVREVYNRLGDVQGTPFSVWFEQNAIQYFGKPGLAPKVRSVAVVGGPSSDRRRYEMIALELRLLAERSQDQPTRLLAVPLNLKKTQVLNQVKELLEQTKPMKMDLPVIKATYELAGDRHRIDSIRKFLELAKLRAHYIDEPTWKVGLRFGIGANYAAVFGPAEDAKATANNIDARNTLNVIMARALTKARYLAENAARGIFPVNTKCEHALDLNFKWMKQNMKTREDILTKEQARIEEASAYWRLLPIDFLKNEWLNFELQLTDALGHCDL